MGRQAYLASLALGRSAYGPAPLRTEDGVDEGATSSHTSPTTSATAPSLIQPSVGQTQDQARADREQPAVDATSRALAHAVTRAKNDVLATCGMLKHVKKSRSRQPQDAAAPLWMDQEQIGRVMAENQLALRLKPLYTLILAFAPWWNEGMRLRYEAFHMFADVPYWDMMGIQWRHFGPYGLLLAGLPCQFLLTIVNVGRETLLRSFQAWAWLALARHEPSRQRRKHKQIIINAAYLTLDLIIFIFLAPLEYYTILQMLNLLPPTPLFPPLRALLPFSASSPFRFAVPTAPLTLAGLASSTLQSLRSPLFLLWSLEKLSGFIQRPAVELIRMLLPTPDRPDLLSVQAAMIGDLTSRDIPGIDPTWRTKPAEIVTSLARLPSVLRRWWADLWQGAPPGRDGSRGGTVMRSRPGLVIDEDGTVRPASAHASIVDDGFSLDTQRAVPESADVALETSSDMEDESRLQRVTRLSSFPSTTTATHVTLLICHCLTMPLEAIFVCSLAHSFLADPRSLGSRADAVWWSSQIYMPFAAPGLLPVSARSSSEQARISRRLLSNLVTCVGMDMAAHFALFEVSYLAVIWLGRSQFAWGQ